MRHEFPALGQPEQQEQQQQPKHDLQLRIPQEIGHLVKDVACLSGPGVSLRWSTELAARALHHLVHHEAADTAGVRRRLGRAHRRDDQHQASIAVTVQVLAEIDIAELPAAGLGGIEQVTFQDICAGLIGNGCQFSSVHWVH